MNHDAYERPRYSNTLLVSLNNRIYFRDHSGSSGDGDAHFTIPPPVHTARRESIHFATVETQLQSPVQVLKLETSSYSRDMESGHVDSASINSDPRYVLFLVSPAIQFNISGSSNALGDIIKTGPSIA